MDNDLKLKCDKPVWFLIECRSWNETWVRRIIIQSTPKQYCHFFSGFPSSFKVFSNLSNDCCSRTIYEHGPWKETV